MANGLLVEEEKKAVERITVHRLVVLVCHKLQLPADRAWQMTAADLCTTLMKPDEEREEVTTAIGQKMLCLEEQRKYELRKQLTPEQWIELARWKAELT